MKSINYILIVFYIITNTFAGIAQEKLILSYTPTEKEQMSALADKQVYPSSASVDKSAQPGEGIEKTIDGDLFTIYHSNYGSTTFPIKLTYNFKDIDQIDYLVYHPRQDGTNGNFKEVEIWYTTTTIARTKYNDFNFEGSSDASRVVFSEPLKNPVKIEVIVKSGVGDNETGYASCAEMRFCKFNYSANDFFNLFEDKLATKLKSNVTLDEINKIPNSYLRKIAKEMYNNSYSLDGRIGEFQSYLDRKVINNALIGSAYNKYENPTGIYFPKGQHIVIADNIAEGSSISLLIPDFKFGQETGTVRGNIISNSYPISNGINIINVEGWDGLGYISYFSENPEQKDKVKIHFLNSQVQGYFDITKHNNKDWENLLNSANLYPVFDAVGRHCQLIFPVEDYKKYANKKGVELVNVYDSLVTYQHRFIGLEKYNRPLKNHILCRINYSYFMFKDGDGASFEKGTMSYVANPDVILKKCWGQTHEIGHIHQMKYVTWSGMGEVSVNFPNLYVNHMFPSDNTSMSTNMSRQKTRRGMAALYNKNPVVPHASYGWHEDHKDHNMMKLAPFAILYHYMRVEQKRPDYYADLYELFRTANEDTKDWKVADFEWYFVKRACDAAQLNLVPYFEAWGFLYVTDIAGREPFDVEDYTDGLYELSNSKLQDLKDYVAAKKYPTPNIDSIMSDNVINQMTAYDY